VTLDELRDRHLATCYCDVHTQWGYSRKTKDIDCK